MPWKQASVLPCQAFANGDHLAVLGDTIVCTGADAGATPRTGPQGPMSVSVYSAREGMVRNLHGHARDVRCVALDGDIVASGDCDGVVRLWALASGAQLSNPITISNTASVLDTSNPTLTQP